MSLLLFSNRCSIQSAWSPLWKPSLLMKSADIVLPSSIWHIGMMPSFSASSMTLWTRTRPNPLLRNLSWVFNIPKLLSSLKISRYIELSICHQHPLITWLKQPKIQVLDDSLQKLHTPFGVRRVFSFSVLLTRQRISMRRPTKRAILCQEFPPWIDQSCFLWHIWYLHWGPALAIGNRSDMAAIY